MIINRRSVLVSLLVICGLLSFLIFYDNKNVYNDLVFSRESGFYDSSFELELHSPIGTSIYYTLDGSVPNEKSLLYTGPISIDDATTHENVHSARTDVVWRGFTQGDIMKNGSVDPMYKVPDYLIDKCTVVRAAYKDADGNFSKTKTASYFVNFDHKNGYEGISILSIITDPSNLFDYERGIYVFPLGFRSSANYMESGMDWERDAVLQIYNSNKELILNQDCGIRIQGGVNRERLPKSLNIYAREQYSGDERFYIDLFGTKYMADTLTLFTSGEDAISKCRDVLASRLTDGRNFAVMNYEPCAMFLDGEYWGFYWLTEKYNDTYFEHYYDVNDDNVIMIKASELAEGEESDYILYTDMLNYLSTADLSLSENYAHACELIDIQSYIDYYAAEIYIGHDSDWPGRNEGLWRTRSSDGSKYEDGKWRWFLYDVNCAMIQPDSDTITITMNTSDMFFHLCQNEDFKRRFVTTFMDLVNTSFSRENVDTVISKCVDQMESPMENHLKRFFAFEDSGRYLEEVAYIQNFFDNRKPYITKYLKQDFGLNGTLAPVSIEINDAKAGNIIVNTTAIAFDESHNWNGEYYTDYPITLTAVANDGYRLVKWDIDKNQQFETDHIEVDIKANGISIGAVFEKTDE